MDVDGWHIPDSWAEGSNEGSVRYVGSIRVWPVGSSDFAVVGHHIEECSMNAYYGPVGILRSRQAPQQAWDLEHLGMFACEVVSLPVADGHLALINASFRGSDPQESENPMIVVHVPSMRLSAIRFVRGWSYVAKRIVDGRIVFEHDPHTGELKPDARSVVEVPIDQLTWTEYESRPRSRAQADAWIFHHSRPRDVDVLAQLKSWVRSELS